jgi:hypothetical protein
MTKDEDVKVLKEWKAHGLRCKVLISPVGSINGYVAVPKSHSAWGANYDNLGIDVHGGLTFGQRGNSGLWNDPDLYWFGFDTAHAGDWVNYSDRPSDHKWTLDEVIKETTYMAKQFAEMKTKVFLDYSAKETIKEYFGDEVLNEIMLGKVPTKVFKEEDIYVEMPPNKTTEMILITKEKWEKIKALPEKWRNRDKCKNEVLLGCADELDEELK